MGRLLQSKVLSHHYEIPFSEVTLIHQAEYKGYRDNYVLDIEDGRSTFIKRMGGLTGTYNYIIS